MAVGMQNRAKWRVNTKLNKMNINGGNWRYNRQHLNSLFIALKSKRKKEEDRQKAVWLSNLITSGQL